jgi:carbamoyltransferase
MPQSRPLRILGVSAFYHDSAAALVVDGSIVAAAQEERFTRRKHDASFPRHAIEWCLAHEGIRVRDLDYVAFYDKPFLKFERLLETYLSFAPRGFRSFRRAMPLWLREKLFQKRVLQQQFRQIDVAAELEGRLLFAEHHESHAASAFFPSPFEHAAILTVDGVGEWATTAVGVGHGNKLELTHEIHFPHSLGLLYSAFTYFTGFKVNSGEYKLMGLAPYGEPRFANRIRDHLIDVRKDGSFRLNLEYFDYCTGLRMTNARFAELFGVSERLAHAPLRTVDMDLAASIQTVIDDVMIKLARFAVSCAGVRDLCLAGGVALNCVANGRLVADGVCSRIWTQPAAGDAGGAIGAALGAYHGLLARPRDVDPTADAMRGSLLGPAFSQAEIEQRLGDLGADFTVFTNHQELVTAVAERLAQGQAIGWFQGPMEFGPRALGARSILADPRLHDMQRTLNLKIKFRESFRPFAPAVLAEHASDWFSVSGPSPYMLLVAPVDDHRRCALTPREAQLTGMDKLKAIRSQIPAVTHVDYSARIQTVDENVNPLFHALISEFYKQTDCPVLVNTSFNVRGEPIVCSPQDAYRCFMGTGLDALVIGRCMVAKSPHEIEPGLEYAAAFAPD